MKKTAIPFADPEVLMAYELSLENLEQVSGGSGTDRDPGTIVEVITKAVLHVVKQLLGGRTIIDYDLFTEWYQMREKIIDVLVEPWLPSDYYAIYMSMGEGPRAEIRGDVFMRLVQED